MYIICRDIEIPNIYIDIPNTYMIFLIPLEIILRKKVTAFSFYFDMELSDEYRADIPRDMTHLAT